MFPISRAALTALVLLLPATAASQPGSVPAGIPGERSTAPASLREMRPGPRGIKPQRQVGSMKRCRPDGRPELFRGRGPRAFSMEASGQPQELPLLWTNHFASEDAAGEDEPYAAAVDVSGNTYITGSSTRLPFGSDYLTVKFGPPGNLLWAVRYPGHSEGENIAQAITVDGLGNVYVTGGSPDVHFWDIATIKYNALGVQQWVARWGSEAGFHDGGTAIAVDVSGNVYVAGWAMGEGRDYDALLLSYSPQGEDRWQRRYDDPHVQVSTGPDAITLAPAPGGGVYAAMTAVGEDSSDDILILCLDSEGGELWRDQFTGPMGSDNTLQAIAVDPWGALIVGGMSDGWGTDTDFLVLKYGSGGFHEWTARFDGPATSGGDWLLDIAVDDSGNVYACGFVDDYTVSAGLLCLDRHGNEKWVQYHTAPGTGQDMVGQVRFVPPGDIRMSGEAYQLDPSLPNELFVVQYDTAGNLGWDSRVALTGSTSSFTMDAGWEPGGASYVFAYADTRAQRANYAVMKVGSDGSIHYDAQYDGPGTSYDEAQVGWVHASGALSLAGYTLAGGKRMRARTVRFEPDGTLSWVQQYFSPEDSVCAVRAITGDRDGNTYVAAFTYEPASDLDIVTIKYTPDGLEEWKDRYIMPGPDVPAGIAVDDSGNVYVVGTLEVYSGSSHFLVLKYGPGGSRLWNIAFDAPANASNTAGAVAAFPGGGICFSGDSWGPGPERAMATMRLDPNGDQVWTALHKSPSGYMASAQTMAVSDSGVVYVAGSEPDASAKSDPLVVRYSPQGVEDWSLTVPSAGTWEGFDRVIALPWGGVQLLGHLQGDPYQQDLLTVRLGADGQEIWRADYASPLDGDDTPSSICIDSLGNLYVTASCESPETMSRDCITLKYDGMGVLVDLVHFPGPGTSMEEPVVSGIDPEGNLLIGGTERGSRWNWSVMRAMKFGPSVTGLDPALRGVPGHFGLDQNYPNPFNPVTTIRVAVPARSQVRVSVFNLLGQHMATIVDRVLEAGTHLLEFDASRLPSGVYIYTMTAGTFVQSRKMVVLR